MNESVDTSNLDPAALAKHLGHPEGEIGKAVTANLNKSNAGAYSASLRKLGMNAGDRVIEIGFGNGREIPSILSRSTDVTYFGLDISDTMVVDATEFNADDVLKGRVTLAQGTSAAIPADANTFDKALALNTIYFWPNPVADLQELRRVLRSDGRFVIGALAPWSAVGRAVFQHGFRFYEQSEIRNLLASAGFSKVSIDTINETVVGPMGQPWNRDYFIVVAE
ncbi:Ubiquinone/menaquinone biosynthesis C-methylase UbiE [Bradyrhizobium lablabi]|uniref:Ubiquinone/menaquinone biosynthesis C-methylase UbiE n=1 Tax=Bradyrhizobium lablabi TaxID=722472 RepID=A0A1M6N9K1_9BRAD|nr:class I SAM-dependent methyltransferase [Bradyrhizobium lablabi]SHJ92379.1 Ubiquinone/menaquinone biosynthesis C-methylase UbiE [Bradyrhizobium lablabi]